MEEKIKVFVRINENNEIVEIGSNVFINDLTNWICVDEGYGDKFAHAQSQYLNKPLMNEQGAYNFILEENVIKEK